MALFKALEIAACLLFAATAHARTYDDLYVFGDSLVNSGNAQTGAPFFGIGDPAPAAVGYVQGRFSNGFNFADDLSSALGFGPATAYLQGGTNYAVGGATTAAIPPGTLPDPTNDFIPSFGQQIAVYEDSLDGASPPFPTTSRPAIDSNSLVLVTFGGNDVRDLVRFGVPSLSDTVSAFATGLQQLVDDGARNIVVVGLPDIGRLPSLIALGPAAEAAGTGLSFTLNTSLQSIVDGLDTGLGSSGSVDFFDLFGLQTLVSTNPAGFGLDPALLQTSCVADGAQATGCAGYLFFDGIHPTAAVHGLIADAIGDQLAIGAVPEPAAWMIMIFGFGMIGLRLRRSGAYLGRETPGLF